MASEESIRAAGFVPDGKGGWHKPERTPVILPSGPRGMIPPVENLPAIVLPKGADFKITTPKERMQALGRLAPGEKNKTEQSYEDHLKARRDVVWYCFEGIKFRLADNTYYTPDYLVMLDTGHLEVHEVKGFWTDDAKVKIKVASDLFPPFKFVAVFKLPKKKGGGWRTEEY